MVREAFIDKDFSRASFDLITKADAVIRAYAAQGYDLSLRQLYYQFVSRNWLENTERSYKRLGNIISEARLAGMLDWDAIKDRGRTVVSNSHWDGPADMLRAAASSHRIDKWEGQDNYVEVMVEKQALEGVLVPVCQRLDINFTANKGYSSSSAMYEASKRFIDASQAGKDCYVMYLGDHDPSGMDMGRDVLDRLDLFMYRSGIAVNRLALNYDQIQQYNPPPNPAKMTDSRAGGYVARFGDESWELDALEPSVLAALVTDAVEDIRDPTLWRAAVEREEKERALLDRLANEYEDGNLKEFMSI